MAMCSYCDTIVLQSLSFAGKNIKTSLDHNYQLFIIEINLIFSYSIPLKSLSITKNPAVYVCVFD